MKRMILFAGSAILLSVATFVGGVVVGAKQYFPYQYLVIAKQAILGGGEKSAKEVEFYDVIHPRYLETDPQQIIDLENAEQVKAKRERLIKLLWNDSALPVDLRPHVDQGISDERVDQLNNLDRIDRLTVQMDFGLQSVCYHFIPKEGNGNLVIYHHGHNEGFVHGQHTIDQLLQDGYSVIGISMPLLGMNNQPVVHLKRFGRIKISSHKQMDLLTDGVRHPLRFFIEPVIAAVNYSTEKYESIDLVGFSGGGWTAVVSAALDTRIARSYSVAGSLPLYLRSEMPRAWGDYEQNTAPVYFIANYLELYALSSTQDGGGPRRHVQILNRYDDRVFFGIGYRTYEKQVADAVHNCGRGSFEVILDETHQEHQLSEWAMARILADLALPVEGQVSGHSKSD